jgi:hypothetical protein
MRARCLPIIMVLPTILSGCGLSVPQMGEVWEGRDIVPGQTSMETRIKEKIFCETVDALKYVRANYRVGDKSLPSIPDDYGVQMQISLTVEETGALNPSATYMHLMHNGAIFDIGSGVTVSSTATRVDTSYSYYNVGKIAGIGKNEWCNNPEQPLDIHGSSFLLQSDLGIRDYLSGAVEGADMLPSSAAATGGSSKGAKIDVYSYDIKFVIVSTIGVNPVWKLVNLTTGTSNLSALNLGRTRTHDLVLTFGPGIDQPTLASLQTHFTTQIVQSNQQRNR